MSEEIRLWQVGTDHKLSEIQCVPLDLEARLQEWLARDIAVLDPRDNGMFLYTRCNQASRALTFVPTMMTDPLLAQDLAAETTLIVIATETIAVLLVGLVFTDIERVR